MSDQDDNVPGVPSEQRVRREVVRRLRDSLGEALELIDAKESKVFHTLYVPADGPPEVHQFNEVEEVCGYIATVRLSLRTQQIDDPTYAAYLYIFRGDRCQIELGRKWKLHVGDASYVVDSAEPVGIATDGMLTDPDTLDLAMMRALQPRPPVNDTDVEAITGPTTISIINPLDNLVRDPSESDDDDLDDDDDNQTLSMGEPEVV
jgi:hypothetical protein